MAYLYTLQLQSGKYYVGKSDDPDTRYLAHKSGNGAVWTKIHKPLKIIEIRELKGEHDETNTTKDLMKKYGVDNVRGGAYTQSILDDATKAVLEREILGNTDKCYKCGEAGHFANRCSKKVEVVEVEVCGYLPSLIVQNGFDMSRQVDSSYIVEEAPHKMSGTFTISQNDLQALYNEYRAAGDYNTATQIGQYLKKSYKTGVFKITRIGLLREAKWAKENEHDEWHRIVTGWAEKAV